MTTKVKEELTLRVIEELEKIKFKSNSVSNIINNLSTGDIHTNLLEAAKLIESITLKLGYNKSRVSEAINYLTLSELLFGGISQYFLSNKNPGLLNKANKEVMEKGVYKLLRKAGYNNLFDFLIKNDFLVYTLDYYDTLSKRGFSYSKTDIRRQIKIPDEISPLEYFLFGVVIGDGFVWETKRVSRKYNNRRDKKNGNKIWNKKRDRLRVGAKNQRNYHVTSLIFQGKIGDSYFYKNVLIPVLEFEFNTTPTYYEGEYSTQRVVLTSRLVCSWIEHYIKNVKVKTRGQKNYDGKRRSKYELSDNKLIQDGEFNILKKDLSDGLKERLLYELRRNKLMFGRAFLMGLLATTTDLTTQGFLIQLSNKDLQELVVNVLEKLNLKFVILNESYNTNKDHNIPSNERFWNYKHYNILIPYDEFNIYSGFRIDWLKKVWKGEESFYNKFVKISRRGYLLNNRIFVKPLFKYKSSKK